MFDTIISIQFYFLSLKRPRILFSVLIFPQFLTSNPPSPNHHLTLLNPCSYQPYFTQYHMGIWVALSHPSLPPHPAHIAAYPYSPVLDLSCSLLPLRLAPLPLLCNWCKICVIHTHSPFCAKFHHSFYHYHSLLELQLSTFLLFTLLTSFQNNFLFPFTSSFICPQLFIYFLFALIYTHFNLFIFFSVCFHMFL